MPQFWQGIGPDTSCMHACSGSGRHVIRLRLPEAVKNIKGYSIANNYVWFESHGTSLAVKKSLAALKIRLTLSKKIGAFVISLIVLKNICYFGKFYSFEASLQLVEEVYQLQAY